MVFQPVPQVSGLTVGLVRGHPGERDAGVEGAGQHRHQLPRLGGELDFAGDVRGTATVPVVGPGLR